MNWETRTIELLHGNLKKDSENDIFMKDFYKSDLSVIRKKIDWSVIKRSCP